MEDGEWMMVLNPKTLNPFLSSIFYFLRLGDKPEGVFDRLSFIDAQPFGGGRAGVYRGFEGIVDGGYPRDLNGGFFELLGGAQVQIPAHDVPFGSLQNDQILGK